MLLLAIGVCGAAAVRRLCPSASRLERLGLSGALGMGGVSIGILGLDLIGLSLGRPDQVLGALLLMSGLALLLVARGIPSCPDRRSRSPHPADAVAMLVVVPMIVLSLHQNLATPVIFQDAILGMDLVAKQALADGTLDSQVFGPALDGYRSNQPFYAPFSALMQVAFRLAGLPEGKLWPGLLFAAAALWGWGRLRDRSHPAVAAVLVSVLVSAPLWFSSSWLVSTDLANAVFLAMGVGFVHDWAEGGATPDRRLVLASLFFGLATWTRSETIALVVVGAAASVSLAPRVQGKSPRLRAFGGLLVGPAIAVAVWHGLYIPLVLDQPGTTTLDWTWLPADWLPTGARLLRLVGASELYGSVPILLGVGVAIGVVVFRSARAITYLLWVLVVLAGMWAMATVVPAASIDNTAKRGLLKLLPLAVLYLGEGPVGWWMSRRLDGWTTPPRDAPSPLIPPLDG